VRQTGRRLLTEYGADVQQEDSNDELHKEEEERDLDRVQDPFICHDLRGGEVHAGRAKVGISIEGSRAVPSPSPKYDG
jgi:hypothetical protein